MSRTRVPLGSLLARVLAVTLVSASLFLGNGSGQARAAAAVGRVTAQGQAKDQLLAAAKKVLARRDAQQATIEDSAERVNALTGKVRSLQARITTLDQQRRALGNELVGADEGSGSDPVAGLRRLSARFLNGFATALSGGLGGRGDQHNYGPVLLDLPQTIDDHQRQGTQLASEQQTLGAMYTRFRADEAATDPKVGKLADKLNMQRERQAQQEYTAWTKQVAGQLGAGPMQPGGAARGAVAYALAQQGDPYVWGAVGPDSFDCSGLTSTAFRQVGVSIPRVSIDQSRFGAPVAFNNLIQGDLVFFGNPVHHVGMYVGDGRMVHAPHTGDHVRVASIWRRGYAGARRPVAAIGGTGAVPPPLPPPVEVTEPEAKAPLPPTSSSGGGGGGGGGGSSSSGTTETSSTVTESTPSQSTTTETTTGGPTTGSTELPSTTGTAPEQPGAAPEATTAASAAARDPPIGPP